MKICTLLVLIIQVISFSQPFLQWEQIYDGNQQLDRGNSVAVDGSGDIYVAGNSYHPLQASNIIIRKYDCAGQLLWSQVWNGPANGNDHAKVVKVDHFGNVLVTGKSQSSNGSSDIMTLKYSSGGKLKWAKLYNGNGNGEDIGFDLTSDNQGNIYVVGASKYYSDQVSKYKDGVAIKYDSIGTYIWNFQMNFGNENEANHVLFTPNGTLLITAYLYRTPMLGYDPQEDRYKVFEIHPVTKNIILEYSGGTWDAYYGYPNAIVTDQGVNFFVLSSSLSSSSEEVDTRKFKYGTKNSIALQTKYIGMGFTGFVKGVDLKLDQNGNVYTLENVHLDVVDNQFYLIKYDNSLTQQLAVGLYGYNNKKSDIPIAMCIDKNSNPNLYVVGNIIEDGNIVLVKYNSQLDTIWTKKYDCGNNGSDVANAMALDASESIYIAGSSNCDNSDLDLSLIKFCNYIPNATITANGPTAFCRGGSVSLSVSTCPGCTYRWSTNETTSSITVSPNSNTSYKVTVTDTKCCEAESKTFEVIVLEKPNKPNTINGSTLVCVGSSNIYKITKVNDVMYYKWILPDGQWVGSSDSDTILLKAGNSTGILKVIAVNNCGISDTAALTIHIKDVPSQPLSISGETRVCAGLIKTYSVFKVNGATEYRWEIEPKNSDWKSNNSKNDTVLLTTGESNVKLKVYAANDCGDSQSQELEIKVQKVPQQPIEIFGSNSVCGETVNTYYIVPLANSDRYNWSSTNNAWLKFGQTDKDKINFQSTSTGTVISVSGHNDFCNVDGPVQTLVVDVRNVDISITQNNATLIANANNASYQWLDCTDPMNPIVLNGEINKEFTPVKTANYSVIVEQNNCSDTSECRSIIVANEDTDKTNGIRLYPNPFDGDLFIAYKSVDLDIDVRIELYNSLGRRIKNLNHFNLYDDKSTKLKLDDLASGIYFICISQGKYNYIRKIQKI